MDSENQRNRIIDFYENVATRSNGLRGPIRNDVIERELSAMLAVWDEVCSAHDDPWQAIRNEFSMYLFPNPGPWGSPDCENFLLVLRGVVEGRGLGINPTPHEIR